MKVTVIMLSWQRVDLFPRTLHALARQTYKDFEFIVSNANPQHQKKIINYANHFRSYFPTTVRADSNSEFSFRRLRVARDAAENGSDIILFIDDDVDIPSDHIEKAVQQYEPKSYKSQFAWKLDDNGSDYYGKRTRVFDRRKRVNYCGTGMCVIDPAIFLEDGLLDAPKGALKIEDLWLSYYAQQVLGWKLQYLDIDGIKLGGNDRVALFKSVKKDAYNKADFLRDLVAMGWKL